MDTKVTIEIIEALKRGEHKAFDIVYLAYFDKVKRFIIGLIRSEDEAKDLAQDIFAKLWKERESLNTNLSFNSFIYTMTRNAVFNHLKRTAVKTSYASEHIRIEEFVRTPEELVFAKEIELLIEMALCRMPQKRGEIYRLSRNQGLTNDEIASLLKISRKTVENNLTLVLNEIRKIILLSILFFI